MAKIVGPTSAITIWNNTNDGTPDSTLQSEPYNTKMEHPPASNFIIH